MTKKCGCEIEVRNAAQKSVLLWLLSINATMFFLEIISGWYAQSTALIADSLDMFADATVYGISLYAIGKTAQHKVHAARISGYLQAGLGISMLIEIARRLIYGSEPLAGMIMLVSIVALLANIICLRLIAAHKQGEVHMRASWIFSKNDVIANIGVLLGGGLVWLTESRWPDIIVASIIAIIILRGALQIIQDARREQLLISSGQN